MEKRMETFMWPIHVRSLEGGEGETVEVLVGTRASYTVLPSKMLKRLGITPTNTAEFELEDGSIVEYEVGDARIQVERRENPAIVVFGDDDVTPLMGAETLHGASLTVAPDGSRLVYKMPRLSGGVRYREANEPVNPPILISQDDAVGK